MFAITIHVYASWLLFTRLHMSAFPARLRKSDHKENGLGHEEHQCKDSRNSVDVEFWPP